MIDKIVERYLTEMSSQEKAHGEGHDAGMKGKSKKNPYEKKDRREWVAWEEGFDKGQDYEK